MTRSLEGGTTKPKPKIVIVDDDKNYVEMVAMTLEDLDVEVHQFFGGYSALKFCLDQKDILAIFSDVRMPNGNGIEFLKGYRAKNTETPFYIMSGYTETTPDEIKQFGATEFFPKPVFPEKILETVENHLK